MCLRLWAQLLGFKPVMREGLLTIDLGFSESWEGDLEAEAAAIDFFLQFLVPAPWIGYYRGMSRFPAPFLVAQVEILQSLGIAVSRSLLLYWPRDRTYLVGIVEFSSHSWFSKEKL